MTEAAEHGPEPVGTMWLLDLGQPPDRDSVTPGTPISFQRVGPEAAGALAEAMGLDDPASMLARFTNDRRCYVGMAQGAIATYGWVSTVEEEISELAITFRLAPGDAYIWDCATLPAYRGRGLYPALLVYLAHELRAEGLRRAWIGADSDKVASQRGIARAGFRPAADFYSRSDPHSDAAADRYYATGCEGIPEDVVTYLREALLPD